MASPIFSFQKRKSLTHNCPALIKLVLLLAVAIITYRTSLIFHVSFLVLAIVLTLASHISFKDFLHDLKPICYYSIFIIVLELISSLLFGGFPSFASLEPGSKNYWTNDNSVLLISRLLVTMAYASLFFRTTSNLELQESMEKVEYAITFGHSNLAFSKSFALFLNFLPQLFAIWNKLDKTWRARQGKRGIRKILVLIPVFITLSIKKANDTLLSLLNRR